MQGKTWEIRFVILALFLLFGIAFAKLVLFPLYSARDRLENNNRQILINIEELEKIKLDRNQPSQNTGDQNLMIMIPTEPQLSQLYTYADLAAEESEVFLLGAYFSEQEKKAGQNKYAKKTFNLTAQGSFGNLMLFIKALETNPRLLVISSMSFTRQMKLSEAESPGITSNEAVSQLDSINESISHPQGQQMATSIEEDITTYKTEMQIDYFYLPEPKLESGNSED